MKKSRLSLLVVATVIATIVVAGCTSPTQTSPQVASTNTTTSSTTATTGSSSAVKTAASATPSPSPSASPTPTGSPQASGKIATSITATGLSSPPLPTFTSGKKIQLAIVVTSNATGLTVCGGSVTVLVNGASTGQVTSGGASGCFKTAYFTLSSGLPKNNQPYTLTLSYSGDSAYQSSTSTVDITVN